MTRDQLYTIVKIENFNKEIIKKTRKLGEHYLFSGIAIALLGYINIEIAYEIYKNSLPITPTTLIVNVASIFAMLYLSLIEKKLEKEIDKITSDKEEYIKTL